MKKHQRFSETFKRQVVQEVLSGSISKEACRRKYGIGGKSNIAKWILKFTGAKPIVPMSKRIKNEEVDRLRLENERLKAALEREKLKTEAYRTMIEIAEETFKIPIEKKSGAKQSKK